MPSQLKPFVFASITFLLALGACVYDSSDLADATCDEEGLQQDGRVCQDGYWIEDDTAPNNTEPNDGECDPDDDEELCGDLECGTHEFDDDGCGDSATVNCGDCGDEFCLEDSWTCSPCPALSTEELCEELLPEGEVCGKVDLPDECGDDAGTLDCTCGDIECGEWSDCVVEDSSCTGTRTRECSEPQCVDNTECSTFTTEESESCTATAGSECSDDVGDCQVGACDGDGTCVVEANCDGSTESCGCTECQDCSAQDGWYVAENSPVDCCDENTAGICQCTLEEYREFSCDGTECTFEVIDHRLGDSSECNPCEVSGETQQCTTSSCDIDSTNTCAVEGVQTETCNPYICVPGDDDTAGASCQLDTDDPEETTYTCSLDDPPIDDPCDNPADSSCETGICFDDGTCGNPCDDCGCSIDDCQDCSELEPETQDDGHPEAICDGTQPQILQDRLTFQPTCQDNECSIDGVTGDPTTDNITDELFDSSEILSCDSGGNPSCETDIDDDDIDNIDDYESIACCFHSNGTLQDCYGCDADGDCVIIEND